MKPLNRNQRAALKLVDYLRDTPYPSPDVVEALRILIGGEGADEEIEAAAVAAKETE